MTCTAWALYVYIHVHAVTFQIGLLPQLYRFAHSTHKIYCIHLVYIFQLRRQLPFFIVEWTLVNDYAQVRYNMHTCTACNYLNVFLYSVLGIFKQPHSSGVTSN